MWLLPLWAAVSALLLSLPGALLHVAAPEEVRVRCGDEKPLVSWNYSSDQPTNFTVQLLGSGRSYHIRTRAHELDLSSYVWSSPAQMLEYFYVLVTAEQEPNRSKPSNSPSFSYNGLKPVDQSCNLTFPPINLTREGADATLSMENPLYFYKELRDIKHSAVFKLNIIKEHGHKEEWCFHKICKFSVDLPEDAEPCVNLTGSIEPRPGAEINFQQIDRVCITPPTDGLWLVAILVVVIFVCVIALLSVAVCKYRAWAFPKIPTPQTLKLPSSPNFRSSMTQPDPVYSPVQITGPRPETTLDLESPSPPEIHQDQDQDQVPFLPADPREDQDESADSTQTETETLSLHSSSSETEESNYERRAEIMDLSGDRVIGYTG